MFKAVVDEIFETMRESATLPDHGQVRIPGDRRRVTFDDRTANGVPLHPKLVETLSDIAGELKIPELA